MQDHRTAGIVLSLTGLRLLGAACAATGRAPAASSPPQATRVRSEVVGPAGVPNGRAAGGSAREGPPEKIPIAATDRGFEPSKITVVRNRRVTLSFLLETSRASRRDVLIRISPEVELRQRPHARASGHHDRQLPENGDDTLHLRRVQEEWNDNRQ